MPTYKIRGIDVDFPFEAYECQLVYMEKVIESLQNKSNALLESPTGTGKTLCLLCSTLAWRKSLGEFSRGRSERVNIRASQNSDDELPLSQSSKYPPIIYTSRTHSQIKQVIQELRRSNYRSEFAKKNPGIGDDPMDIEDLVNIGRSSGPCPYYLSREIHRDVDIIFAPYNYLIDRGNRKTLKINWDSSILIFDEAHNLESLCADAASFDLPSSLLTACISEAKKCIDLSVTRREISSDKSCKPDDFAILRALLLKLEKRIAEVPIESKDLGYTKAGPYIYELLAELNITQKTADMLIRIIEKGCELLEEDANVSETGGSNKPSGTIFRLESMGDILRLIYRDNSNAHAQYYRVHVRDVEPSGTDAFRGKTSRTLSWWCFNPGIAMEEFSRLGVGSIILTSGTLSPMESFAEELKLPFPIRLENPHVISGNQIWAGVAPVGPSGYSFNSSYRSRGSIEYKLELGNAIVNFARIVPDGLLVFFPSYYLLEQCISCWKTMGQQNSTNSTTVWERICKHKLPVVEPRQASLFPAAIEDYMSKLKETSSSGAVFFAVCRGKVSEGLDFADHAGRAVVITGLPFATMTDAKVRLKCEYLDQQSQSQKIGNKALNGEEWYSQQASRAVNQAVGRVIRHQHDYGAIIFCDERFAQSNRQSQVSLWIQPHFKCYSKFGDVVYTLTRFFRDSAKRDPPKMLLARNQDQGNVRVFPVDPPSSLDSASSSIKQVKQSRISTRLEEIVPANRSSSLTSGKKFENSSLKYSSDLIKKEPLISGNENIQGFDGENDDLVVNSKLKKRKMLITGPDLSKQYEKLSNSIKNENLQFSESASTNNPRGKREFVVDDGIIITQKKNAAYNNIQAGKEDVSQNIGETKGSAFLIQVREKLSDAEYKEFVGFMKGLKTKAMKIGHVLQSIARLFSAPDRLPLLHGFKEYVPAKYHSLYEHYLCTNSNAAGV